MRGGGRFGVLMLLGVQNRGWVGEGGEGGAGAEGRQVAKVVVEGK